MSFVCKLTLLGRHSLFYDAYFNELLLGKLQFSTYTALHYCV